MASLQLVQNGKYWRIRFKNIRQSPVSKDLYYPTKAHDAIEGYTRIQIEKLKKDMEYDYKHGWNPWKQADKHSQSVVTIQQAIDQTLKLAKPLVAPNTLKTKTSILRSFAQQFGAQRAISNLSSVDVEDWINEANKFNSRKKRKAEVTLLYKMLHKRHGVELPSFEIRASREEKNAYYNKDFKTFLLREQLDFALTKLRRGEFRSWIKKDRELLADFYLLGFLTGRRRGDLLALRGEWVSMTTPVLQLFDDTYLAKGKRFEWIELNEEAWTILKVLKKDGLLFGEFSPAFVSEEFDHLIKHTMPPEISSKITLHKLRDSAIMHMMYREELNIPTIMGRVGHAGISSLQKYVHPHGQQIIRVKIEQWKAFLQSKGVERGYNENGLRLIFPNNSASK